MPGSGSASFCSAPGRACSTTRCFQNGIPLVAAIHGFFIGACALLMERGTLLPRLQARLRRLPTFLYVPIAELAYVG